MLIQGLFEGHGFHQVGVFAAAMGEGGYLIIHAIGIGVAVEGQPPVLGQLIPETNHFFKFPGGVDVQQGKGEGAWVKGFARQVQHHHRVLADAEEHHRLGKVGDHFTHDVNGFGFQLFEVGQAKAGIFRIKAYNIFR